MCRCSSGCELAPTLTPSATSSRAFDVCAAAAGSGGGPPRPRSSSRRAESSSTASCLATRAVATAPSSSASDSPASRPATRWCSIQGRQFAPVLAPIAASSLPLGSRGMVHHFGRGIRQGGLGCVLGASLEQLQDPPGLDPGLLDAAHHRLWRERVGHPLEHGLAPCHQPLVQFGHSPTHNQDANTHQCAHNHYPSHFYSPPRGAGATRAHFLVLCHDPSPPNKADMTVGGDTPTGREAKRRVSGTEAHCRGQQHDARENQRHDAKHAADTEHHHAEHDQHRRDDKRTKQTINTSRVVLHDRPPSLYSLVSTFDPSDPGG